MRLAIPLGYSLTDLRAMIFPDFMMIVSAWRAHQRRTQPPSPGQNAPSRATLEDLMERYPDV